MSADAGTTVQRDAARTAFEAAFATLDAARRQREAAWLADARSAAFARFGERGLPTRRDEDWKYTNVQPIGATEFAPAPAVPAAAVQELVSAVALGGPRVLLVNGRAADPAAPLPAGVTATPLAEADDDDLRALLGPRLPDDAFSLLNVAFFEDGVVLDVAPGTVLDAPLEVIHVASAAGRDGRPFAVHPRIVLRVGAGARLVVVETWCGRGAGGSHLTNAAVDVIVGDGASLEHVKVEDESRAAFHVAATRARVAKDARYASRVIVLGGNLVRNGLHVALAGAGAHVDADGLYRLGGTQHVDNHTVIEHAVANTTSRELYKGILDGRSRGIFYGRIIVRPGAQKISAQQTNNNLLLSTEALANSTPQLEIHADDVQCRHGSTIGRLDETALFYLRSRGLPAAHAREMLTYAFANEVIDRIGVPALRERLAARLAGSPAAGAESHWTEE